jgi:putative transcriptional regulator
VSLHHPFDDTLARHAAGRLAAGPSFVVAVHLAGCCECRARMAMFEAAGGALLEEACAVAPPAELFAAALRRIELAVERAPRRPATLSPLESLPAPPWRRLGPRLQWRRLTLPQAPQARLYMLKVAPHGTAPSFAHRGAAFIQVLQGAFHDEDGRYRAGDCIETEDGAAHRPVVDSEAACLCLAAFESRPRLTGWLGRWLQPLLGL